MQGELFETSGPVVDASRMTQARTGWIDQFRITLRLDHLMIGGILALVLYVLVFSFGVEKGKRYAIEELETKKAIPDEAPREPAPIPIPPSLEMAKETTKTEVQASSTPPIETVTSPSHPTSLTGKYTLQLITFTKRQRAEEEVEHLKAKGFQGFIIPSGRYFQVCAEFFQNFGEARQKLMRLKAEGLAPPDAYVRPVKGTLAL